MRGSRLVSHSGVVAPCRASWLSTSADITSGATVVAAETSNLGTSALRRVSSDEELSLRFGSFAHPPQPSRSSPLLTALDPRSTARSYQCRFLRYVLTSSVQSVELLSSRMLRRHVLAPALLLPAARAFHTTGTALGDTTGVSSSHTARVNDDEGEGDVAYSQERHIQNAEALLQEVYGPQAKVVMHRLTQRRRRTTPAAAETRAQVISEVEGKSIDDVRGKDEASSREVNAQQQQQQSDYYYRASATFRLLGFPVELAVANGPRARETIESCLQQALASDITFIRPSAHHNHHQNNNHNTITSARRQSRGGAGPERSGSGQQDRSQGRGRGRQGGSSERSAAHITGFARTDSEAAVLHRGSRLTPHQLELKAIVDDLRQLCTHFSRSVKFSIKPPFRSPADGQQSSPNADSSRAAAASTDERAVSERQWRCRCYVKEEWSTTAQARLALEVVGSSPNAALVRCVSQLRREYRDEFESPAVLEEGVREVAGIVQAQRKTVTASSATEASTASSPLASASAVPSLLEVPTHRAHIDVADARGNVTTYTARRQATPYAAYEAAASLALRGEAAWDGETTLLSEGPFTPPLLWRLRWQFDLLIDHICRETGQAPEEVAWIQLSGATEQRTANASGSAKGSDAPSAMTHEFPAGSVQGDTVVPLMPTHFTASLFSGRDVLVWQTSGGGRYRVEFDAYVHALYHVLDQYADCLSTLPCMARGVGEGLLFPDASVLELHVHRHDAFPILQHHHGNLNCYALLGTLTSQLLGSHYNTHYHFDKATSEFTATLTINDGRVFHQPLIQRRSKKKGEAWRFACLDAMRENFPRQYAAILDRHPEIDLSSDDIARSAHLRALPREKRIPYFASLSVMVLAFAEEELGWRQPRVRLRNLANSLGLPQWTAELEAQAEGEEGRRVVAVSPAFPQMIAARRSLVYRIGMQYFAAEMAVYAALGRTDVINPEAAEAVRVNKFYDPNAFTHRSMVSHVLSLMEAKHPVSAPVQFTVEARVKEASADDSTENAKPFMDLRYVEGDTAQLFSEGPLAILRPPRFAYTARVLGNRGDVLIADFDSDSATTEADAQALPVLVTALKSASFHVAGGDAEALWTEYETQPLPATTSPRMLAAALFDRFFGDSPDGSIPSAAATPTPDKTISGSSGSGLAITASGAVNNGSVVADAASAAAGSSELHSTTVNFNASVTVVTTHLADYWFGTVVLPKLGMLPIARAVAVSKQKCANDALIVAARRSFPRVLQYAVQHDVAAAAMAAEILTEPVVEQLPPSICRDILDKLARKKGPAPPLPFPLLLKCTKENYPQRERVIRVQQTHDTSHGFQCRLYLQRGRTVRPGDTQLVGYGVSATSASAALHRASVGALENLYETALQAAVAAQPNYRDFPAKSD